MEVTLKLSATVACTVTPKLMDTSMLPEPPNVPPSEMVYVPPVEGFVIQCPPCCCWVAFDPIFIVTCVEVGTYTPVPEGGVSVSVDPPPARNVAIIMIQAVPSPVAVAL